jgi:hypothetical protein
MEISIFQLLVLKQCLILNKLLKISLQMECLWIYMIKKMEYGLKELSKKLKPKEEMSESQLIEKDSLIQKMSLLIGLILKSLCFVEK